MTITTPEWVKDAVFYQIFPDRFAKSERLTATACVWKIGTRRRIRSASRAAICLAWPRNWIICKTSA